MAVLVVDPPKSESNPPEVDAVELPEFDDVEVVVFGFVDVEELDEEVFVDEEDVEELDVVDVVVGVSGVVTVIFLMAWNFLTSPYFTPPTHDNTARYWYHLPSSRPVIKKPTVSLPCGIDFCPELLSN